MTGWEVVLKWENIFIHFSFNEKLEVVSSKLKNCGDNADMQMIEFSGFLLTIRG